MSSVSGFNDPLATIAPTDTTVDLSRRRFLLLSGASGLAIGLMGLSLSSGSAAASAEETWTLNAYVHILPTGRIRIYAPNPEVGQGVKTALPMIVAEELDADWNQVDAELAPVAKEYGNQFAGGSMSIPMRWEEMRRMGAMARRMLLEAAASQWRVGIDQLGTASGVVSHKASGRNATYAELAQAAAGLELPAAESLTFKKSVDYSILGRRITGVDNAAVVTGQPLFGIDTAVPDMSYACFVKCPTIGGKAKSANLEEIRSRPGITDAFIIDGNVDVFTYKPDGDQVSSGVAIVGKDTWSVLSARKRLDIDWDLGKANQDNTDQIMGQARDLAGRKGGKTLASKGDVQNTFANSAKVVEAVYSCDVVSHAQLEPQNCVAHHKGDSIEVWAPTQTPTRAVSGLQKLLDLPADKITLHQVRGGGGFGRRLENEYVREAALISARIGAPVKLQWTREDDMAFDYFRPAAVYGLSASLDDKGRLNAWRCHTVAPSADAENPNTSAGFRAQRSYFPANMLEHYQVDLSLVRSSTPTGPVRAPFSNTFAFAEQSFVHELAVSAGRDHLEFLVEAMGNGGWTEPGNVHAINAERAVYTIRKVGENAGWGRHLARGRALGLAFYFSHAGHVAEVAEVSVDADKHITVHKVWVVADIGTVINLSGAENQVEGSVIDGLGAMAQRITVKDGVVVQTNLHQHPLARMNQRPEIEVEFVRSEYSPTGIGEPALPPLAAAVGNAVYTVTGERIRSLPISIQGYSL